MEIHINQKITQVADNACLADVLAMLQPQPPFAVAVNLQFVPRSQYSSQTLHAGDHLEIIAPVTGG